MEYEHGPGIDLRSLSSASLYVLDPVLNFTPAGLFLFDNDISPFLRFSALYS